MNKRQFYNLIELNKWPAELYHAGKGGFAYGLWLALITLVVLCGSLASRADDDAAPSRQLPRIKAGTPIELVGQTGELEGRWNRIVLLARPRIASGDVDAIPAPVRQSVSDFVLTIMAAVERVTDPKSGQPRHQLIDVGLAYSIEDEGRLITVTVALAEQLGLKLGFWPRILLAENEQQLKTAFITARTSTLMIFDVPALVLRGQQHRPYLMRHFVWVDPASGRSSTLLWLIRQSVAGPDVVEHTEPARYIPAGFREDRAMHVDGSQFNLLGIPNKKAFAMEGLPAGQLIDWTPAALELAALRSFDVDSLRQLSTALNTMLQGTPPVLGGGSGQKAN